MKPLSVEILTPNSPLISGISAQFRCSSYGSSPTALMSWIIGFECLTDAHNIEFDGGNGTESMVSFVPTHEHHNQYLICRASNERVANSIIEDKVLLNVECEPRIRWSVKEVLFKIISFFYSQTTDWSFNWFKLSFARRHRRRKYCAYNMQSFGQP